MKKKAPILEEKRRALMARAQQELLEQLPIEQKTLHRAIWLLEPKHLKLTLAAAVGGSALVSALAAVGHDRLYRAAVARELRRQLAPISAKLEALEAQNEELKRQNEALQARLAKK